MERRMGRVTLLFLQEILIVVISLMEKKMAKELLTILVDQNSLEHGTKIKLQILEKLPITMEICLEDNTTIPKKMVRVLTCLMMAQVMKGIFLMIPLMVKELQFTQMVTNIRELLKKDKNRVKDPISILMVTPMRENGLMTTNTALEFIITRTKMLLMKEIGLRIEKMEQEFTAILTVISMLEALKMVKDTEKESSLGVLEKILRESG